MIIIKQYIKYNNHKEFSTKGSSFMVYRQYKKGCFNMGRSLGKSTNTSCGAYINKTYYDTN